MVNNSFRLIGTIVGSFYDIPSGNAAFQKKEFTIEVQKKSYGTQTLKVRVYQNNKAIDTSKDVFGKLVIVEGYIDCYKDYLSLVAQDMFFVGTDEVTNVDELVNGLKEANNIEGLQDADLPF